MGGVSWVWNPLIFPPFEVFLIVFSISVIIHCIIPCRSSWSKLYRASSWQTGFWENTFVYSAGNQAETDNPWLLVYRDIYLFFFLLLWWCTRPYISLVSSLSIGVGKHEILYVMLPRPLSKLTKKIGYHLSLLFLLCKYKIQTLFRSMLLINSKPSQTTFHS